jgi:small conductance mechanosensitive channel
VHAPNILPANVLVQLWSLAIDQSINLIAGILILCAGWMLANFGARSIRAALAKVPYLDPTLKPLVASLVRYAILVFTILAVLERFGVRTTSLIAVLGAIGLGVGLALQGTLSNVASGVLLLLLRCMRTGEEISAGGFTGTVREVGLFRTVLITSDGLYVTLPNTTLFSGSIINNSREPRRLVTINVAIDHSQDIHEAQTLALEVARANKRILRNPEPTAAVTSLGDFDTTVSLTAWTPNADYGNAASELRRSLREKFQEAGIRPPHRLVNVAAPTAISPQASGAAAVASIARRKVP